MAILGVVGLIVAFSSVRDSVISEFSDVGGSVQDITQTFVVNGAGGPSSTTSGMDFGDELDAGDDAEDTSGVADNQISFDVEPTDEFFVSTEGLDVFFGFDGGLGDSSPNGNSNSGSLQNGATIVDGELVLDGVDDFVTIVNSPDINTGGPFPERTLHVEFTPNDVISRQVVYEEGAQTSTMACCISAAGISRNLDGSQHSYPFRSPLECQFRQALRSMAVQLLPPMHCRGISTAHSSAAMKVHSSGHTEAASGSVEQTATRSSTTESESAERLTARSIASQSITARSVTLKSADSKAVKL